MISVRMWSRPPDNSPATGRQVRGRCFRVRTGLAIRTHIKGDKTEACNCPDGQVPVRLLSYKSFIVSNNDLSLKARANKKLIPIRVKAKGIGKVVNIKSRATERTFAPTQGPYGQARASQGRSGKGQMRGVQLRRTRAKQAQ